MLNKFMHMILATSVAWIINNYRRLSIDNAKIKAVKCYVLGLRTVRETFICGVLVLALLLVIFGGLILVHVGIFLLIPSMVVKSILMIALGAVYTGGALYFLLQQCSEKNWMELSSADKLVEQILKERK